MTVGSRAQVWHGTAKHTSGGLNKSQLMMNKSGRIVSRKKHASAKRDNRLVKAGYKTKKGHFGFVKVGTRGRGRKGMKGGKGMMPLHGQPWELVGAANQGPNTRVLMGGAIYGSDAIGAPYNGKGTGMGDSIDVQLTAGMAGGRRRRRGSRRMGMYGGVGMPTDVMYPDGTTQAALNASGGRRRRRGRKSMSMYGGTTKPFSDLNGTPLGETLVS